MLRCEEFKDDALLPCWFLHMIYSHVFYMKPVGTSTPISFVIANQVQKVHRYALSTLAALTSVEGRQLAGNMGS